VPGYDRDVNRDDDPERSIRAQYERHGAAEYYRQFAADYVNPHEPEIRHCIALSVSRWSLDLTNVLDLAAGSGGATLALREIGAGSIDGCEPYLFEQYRRRTSQSAERFSFEDIAGGALAGRAYSLIVCSFALHLADPSRLPRICFQLSLVSPALLILTPHKRPQIEPQWGWELHDEFVKYRIRSRLYTSSFGDV
jgi:hypothetical protein